jgi:hypothetical protein
MALMACRAAMDAGEAGYSMISSEVCTGFRKQIMLKQ